MKSRKLTGLIAFCVCLAASIVRSGAVDEFDLKLVTEGLVSPSALVPLPNSGGAMLVADQAGTIRVLGKDGKLAEKLFLDVRPRLTKLNEGFDERGLLGLALHPKFSENRRFFVVYSAPKKGNQPEEEDNLNHIMRLAEYAAEANGLVAKEGSEKILLEIEKPYFNHNGGMIAFGPDGFLYMAVGDGGNGNDQGRRPPEGNGQNLKTLLGKILRIDINSGSPYGIPPSNPFVGKDGIKPEIYAYGLRNPWRISFDRGGDHELFAGDVGQDGFEEVDIILKGGNYGWNLREGMHCFDPKNPKKGGSDCPKVGALGEPLVDPIMEYKNFKNHPRDPEAKGISITGGYVYRGKALPEWQGKYVFADWSAAWVKPMGVLFAGSRGTGGKWSWQVVKPATVKTDFYITGFGEDAEGELYLLTNASNGLTGITGKIYKIVPR